IDHDAVEPSAEGGLRPPARRIDPDAQQRILHDILGHRLVAKDAPRQPERCPRMPFRQRPKCPLVALRGARHEVMIGWPVHAGLRSAVASGAHHGVIVPAGGWLVAANPSEAPRLWET